MKVTKYLLLSPFHVILLFCPISIGQESSEPYSHPPTSFSAEDSKFPDEVPLPSCARTSLAADEHVASLLKHQNLSTQDLPSDWFTASRQSLSAEAGDLIIVMGTGLMRGANVNPFWVLRVRKNSCSMLLSTGAHDLMIFKHKANGLPDIKTFAVTATTTSERLYRFNGNQYTLLQSKSYPNGS